MNTFFIQQKASSSLKEAILFLFQWIQHPLSPFIGLKSFDVSIEIHLKNRPTQAQNN